MSSIYEKNKLYRQQLENKSERNRVKYRSYRNKLNSIIRFARQNYFENKFNKFNNDTKNTWKVLREILNRKKINLPMTFSVNEIQTDDNLTIDNGFNDFFSSMATELDSKIPTVNTVFSDFLGGSVTDNCVFAGVSPV